MASDICNVIIANCLGEMESAYLLRCWLQPFELNIWSKAAGIDSDCPSLFFCPGLIIHEGSSVYRIFKRWQAVNQQWKVLNYEKSKDLGDPLSSSSKTGARNSRGNPHGLASSSGGRQSRRLRTILNHHCGYTIFHILSQLRPNNPRISTTSNREVVMRVTTVWVGRVRETSSVCQDVSERTDSWTLFQILQTHVDDRSPVRSRVTPHRQTPEEFSSFRTTKGSQMLLFNN